MAGLLTPGHWPANHWPANHWIDDHWVNGIEGISYYPLLITLLESTEFIIELSEIGGS